MSWDVLINNFFGSWLLPPGINLLLVIISFLLFKKYQRVAKIVLAFSMISLWLFSLPWFSNQLIMTLETEPAINLYQIKEYSLEPADAFQISSEVGGAKAGIKRAIVVLAGSRISLAPEYGEIDIVGASSLQRISYASWLGKKTRLPILLSGGSVFNEATPLAVLMNQSILAHFSVAPRWIESESKNTAENAIYSSKILKKEKIDEILLVTHALHMRRAKSAFENQGMKVISAPTGFLSNRGASGYTSFLPRAEAMQVSSMALHEIIGQFWYQLRYSFS